MNPATPQIRQSSNQANCPRGGFDQRIVSYEAIHYIRQQDFSALVSVIDPKDGDIILDAGAGYGAVTREVLSRHQTIDLDFHLLDLSSVQGARAIDELSSLFGRSRVKLMKFIQDSMVHPPCTDDFFNTIVAKMSIHEVMKSQQPEVFGQLYRILKPGGRFVIWDIVVPDEAQWFVRELLRKKDELAGFDYLAENRYFPTNGEWLELFEQAGFEQIKKETDITYKLQTSGRLEPEFHGDCRKLEAWNSHIRALTKELSAEVLRQLEYEDLGNNITVRFPKAIFSARKP
jgi:ubiquinone/menaquinone biosynthesis C-methylase UbiE